MRKTHQVLPAQFDVGNQGFHIEDERHQRWHERQAQSSRLADEFAVEGEDFGMVAVYDYVDEAAEALLVAIQSCGDVEQARKRLRASRLIEPNMLERITMLLDEEQRMAAAQ